MIRGRYLSSMEDASAVLDLREKVFGVREDAGDGMAVYAVVFDHSGRPAGSGRLYIDAHDKFRLDWIGVLEEERRKGLGDLMIRMLLQRALDLQAASIVLTAPEELTEFFARYGFSCDSENSTAMTATPASIDACGGCSGKCCKHAAANNAASTSAT